MFSDEATLHVSGKVNNVRMWGSEHPRAIVEHVADSPKVNVCCGLMHNRLIVPFFFAEVAVASSNVRDTLSTVIRTVACRDLTARRRYNTVELDCACIF